MTVRAVGKMKAENRALELLARYQVSEAPVDPFDIAAREGIRILFENMPRDTSSVLLREPSGRRIICINAAHSPTRKRFSVAHEIGHAFLHFGTKPPSVSQAAVSRPLEVLFRDGLAGTGTDQVEIEANTFAATLLMPTSLITKAFREKLLGESGAKTARMVKELANLFGVSEQAMGYRLVNLGLIDPV